MVCDINICYLIFIMSTQNIIQKHGILYNVFEISSLLILKFHWLSDMSNKTLYVYNYVTLLLLISSKRKNPDAEN